MCGIVGVVNNLMPELINERLAVMGSAIKYRGPDSHGAWVDKEHGVGLGHRRLAIQDLSPHGHQPMVSQNSRFYLTFNGEIYNFLTLRQEMEAKGIKFQGHSDTEVLLESISALGLIDTLNKIQGMFAFALWDRQEKTLTLCRDRLGEKPLYYGWVDDEFLFSSELSAIDALNLKLKIDRAALADYFYYGYVPPPQSMYQGIYKLPPGTLITLEVKAGSVPALGFNPNAGGELSPLVYWSVKSVVDGIGQNKIKNEAQAVSGLDSLLKDVISEQSISDVPLGAFLSGGIDSTSVVAIMQQVNSRATQTFTIGFKDAEFNEASFAKDIARHLGTEHTELYIDGEDCLDLVPKLASIYDEPIADSSQLPTYIVSKLARESVTVCLSGDGGDELFAGYNRYIWTEKIWRQQSGLPLPIRKLLSSIISVIPASLWDKAYRTFVFMHSSSSKQNNVGLKVQKLASLLKCGDINAAYCYLISYWQEENFPLLNFQKINKNFFSDLPTSNEFFVDNAMYWDQLSYLPGDNLTKVDRASMALSLETRLPLLNHKVVEYAWSVPLSMKIKEGQSKWLLRQVLYKYVPREMIERTKMGFSVPICNWLRGPLRSWAELLLNDLDGNIFDKKQIMNVWQQHLSCKYDYSNRLWALLVFLDWYKAQNATI
tara:strand:+ start:1405 stop:3375 length:1971 start_codon:yes stop_codon:yes gene_type:complete